MLGFSITGIQAQNSQEITDLKGEYLGQNPPGIIPEVFAPGIVSDTSWAEHCQVAISPKGDEIFWSAWSWKYPTADGKHSTEQIYYSKLENGVWTKPSLAEFVKDHLEIINGGPVFSPNGKKLFFYSVDRPGGLGSMDTWYIQKTDGKWSNPVNIGWPYNSADSDWSPVFTGRGNAYKNFTKTIKYKYKNGKFSNPDTVIIHKDFSPVFPIYVSPDESYVILDSSIEGGFGDLDLYISFKTEDGSWGYPINMGDKINTEKRERFPVVSPDGKYMFFMRHTETQDFFWVSTDIIKELKKQSINKQTELK